LVPAALHLSSKRHLALCFLPRSGQVPGRNRPVTTNVTVVKVESSSRPSLPVRQSSTFRTIRNIITTMPSYVRPYRSYSFPPCIDSVDTDSSHEDLPDIDEDPFAHFITPIEDDPYDLSLSAGIIIPDGPKATKSSKFRSNVADKWARYVKQSHTQLHSQYHTPTIHEEDEESFMGLDDDRLNDMPSGMTHFTTPRIVITDPSRGRAQDLVARKVLNRRRYSRTLSGHRHSWREPSPDLFTVDESEEEEVPVLRRSRKRSSTRSRSRVTERSRL
jgi:hypothetical protein